MIMLMLLTVTFFVGCGSKEEETVAAQLTAIETYSVKTGDIQLVHNSFGNIKPLREVAIVPKVAEKVTSIMKDMGDRVAEGDILFSLEKTSFYQQLDQLDAQLRQQLMQAEAAMRQTEIQYYSAKEDYNRMKALYEAQAVSRQMLDTHENAYKLAESQYNNAKDNYYLLQNKVLVGTAEDNTHLTAEAKSVLETQKESILKMITDSEVRSPITGIVANRNIEIGEMVSPQMPAFTVVDIDAVVIETEVTEGMISSISIGQETAVSIQALDGKKFTGIVDSISPVVSEQRVGYPVKIIINNVTHEIRPGMFAEISFVIDNRSNTLLVPMEAVLTIDGVSSVFVLKDNDIVARQMVETGAKDGEYFEITKGLQEGDLVVVKGQHFIIDGEKVQPVGGVQ